MKGHKIRFLSVIATFMLISSILSSQALAVARSSKYLDAYGTYVSPVGNGKIVITIDVDALRSMTKIGATTIILYGSKDGKNFTVAKSYNYQDYPIMMSSGKHYYEDLFTYYGTVGLHNGDIYLPPISHQQGYRHMMSIPLLTLIYAALC